MKPLASELRIVLFTAGWAGTAGRRFITMGVDCRITLPPAARLRDQAAHEGRSEEIQPAGGLRLTFNDIPRDEN